MKDKDDAPKLVISDSIDFISPLRFSSSIPNHLIDLDDLAEKIAQRVVALMRDDPLDPSAPPATLPK